MAQDVYTVIPDRCIAHDILRRTALAVALPPYTFQVTTRDAHSATDIRLRWDQRDELQANTLGP
eukprot:4046984-Prorocentrum_lima.AAC.1